MMNKPLICLLFCLSFIAAKSQTVERDVIAAAGDDFKTSAFSLSWTLGEPVVETISNPSINVMLTQGFHQSEFKVTAIKEPLAESFDISVYPNPTPDVLNIRLNSAKEEIIMVQLYSMTGERILFEQMQDKTLQLNLGNLSNASYLLSLRKLNGALITTYVINKTR